jgi:hypothetical protein
MMKNGTSDTAAEACDPPERAFIGDGEIAAGFRHRRCHWGGVEGDATLAASVWWGRRAAQEGMDKRVRNWCSSVDRISGTKNTARAKSSEGRALALRLD